ncbi:MAG: phosphatidylserine decarboxylase [bacterium]
MISLPKHQYIERETGRIKTERLCGDRLIGALYLTARENSAALFRALTGGRMSSLQNASILFEELFGIDKTSWLRAFEGGDFAIFRLTPDKYHYNHTPVAGKIVDIYPIGGEYHSCNPTAVTAIPGLNKGVDRDTHPKKLSHFPP